jgi:pSer/pThr/pTyr-binding forkhead associated (FHA) protein
MAKLRIRDENGKERLHELIDDVTSIGRASSNTIQITDEKGSRQHFRVEKQNGAYVVVDLGSTNGTKLNGTKLGATIALKPGDKLSVGKTSFVFEDVTVSKPVEKKMPVDFSGGETVEMEPVKQTEVKVAEPEAEEKEAPKFVLKMLEGKTPGKVYELGVSALTIGRHNSNTIQIIDDAASNYHAEIGREPIGYVLTDLGSTNGTRVKLKNKTEFEKIIKTPLSVGMQIRVGKTLLEFDNLGKPVEDEALFGTVTLDPQKLEQVLANPGTSAAPAGKSKRVLAVAAILLLGLGVGAFVKLRKTGPDTPAMTSTVTTTSVATSNIPNGDLEEGPDDQGNPKKFKIKKAAPNVHIDVVPEAQYPAGGKYGLQIGKNGAKTPSKPTIVETEEPMVVDASRVYDFTGWSRNESDGLFGLYVRWVAGERMFVEYPAVLQNTQQWKEIHAKLTPPPWAQRAYLGVFVQGMEGKACFDSLDAKVSKDAPAPFPMVSFNGVSVLFEGSKGNFTALANGNLVVEDGTLMLANADGSLYSDLSTAFSASSTKDGDKVSYAGGITDFALQSLREYRLEASPGAAGVDLRAVMNAGADSGCTPQIVFSVVGKVAQGQIEITKADGVEHLSPAENKTFTGAREVLFNAGKSPLFDLMLPNGAEVDIKHQGARCQVTIRFGSELAFSFAPDSMGQKAALKDLIDALRKQYTNKQWGDAEIKIKELRDKFADRYQEARDEATEAQHKLDEGWRASKEEIERMIQALKEQNNTEAADAAKKAVDRHKKAWTGSEHMPELDGYMANIQSLRNEGDTNKNEADAERLLAKAQDMVDKKIWPVAKSILEVKIINDPVLSKTKTAEKAKVLWQKCIDAAERQEYLNTLENKLLNDESNWEKAKNYKRAIEVIEKDPGYQKNKDDLPKIKDKLDDLKRLLKE